MWALLLRARCSVCTQGLIEVLYNLRNALFHGEINPNGDANKVYGAAYHILRSVIECL